MVADPLPTVYETAARADDMDGRDKAMTVGAAEVNDARLIHQGRPRSAELAKRLNAVRAGPSFRRRRCRPDSKALIGSRKRDKILP